MGTMDGRVVLVTGAAGAIGKPMCVELAKRGATVVMAGRGYKLGIAAKEVQLASGSRRVQTLELDLGSLGSMRAAARSFEQRFPRLDVLVNNAAVFSSDRQTTASGFAQVLGVCHLGYFLLTNLLLARLKASAPSRVVVMTMGSDKPIAFHELMSEKNYASLDVLLMTNRANTCFAVELAKRLEGTGVVVNAVNPELTTSTLPREAPLPLWMVFALFGEAPESARRASLGTAVDAEREGVTGNVEKSIPAVYMDAAVRRRLWAESARLVGLAS